MKKYHSRTSTLTGLKAGVRTGPGKMTPGDVLQREAAVLQITRKISRLSVERAKLNRRLKALAEEMRAQRRGLRLVLQRGEELPPGEGPSVLDIPTAADLGRQMAEDRLANERALRR